jgi:hypothetical protein
MTAGVLATVHFYEAHLHCMIHRSVESRNGHVNGAHTLVCEAMHLSVESVYSFNTEPRFVHGRRWAHVPTGIKCMCVCQLIPGCTVGVTP